MKALLEDLTTSIALVTRRQELWELFTSQKGNTFSLIHIAPQELFLRLHELYPNILIYDSYSNELPAREIYQLLHDDPRWKDIELIVLCDPEEINALYELGVLLCLPKEMSSSIVQHALQNILKLLSLRNECERLEEQKRQLNDTLLTERSAQSLFLGKLAHELRNPLSVIEGFTINLLDGLEGPLTPQQQQSMEVVHRNIQRLKQLLNDMLAQSRDEIQIKKQTTTTPTPPAKRIFHRRYLPISDVLNEVIELYREPIKQKGLTFQLEIPEKLPRLWMDAPKIRQVFINLLSNAYKFTESGGTITLRAMTLGEDGQPTPLSKNGRKESHIQIEVSDTGVGIAKEDLPHIFGKFTRSSLTANKIEGTGLGLAICKELIDNHGGELIVESELGQGTTMRVLLPIDLRRRRKGKLLLFDNFEQIKELLQEKSTNYLQRIEYIHSDANLQDILENGESDIILLNSSQIQNVLKSFSK